MGVKRKTSHFRPPSEGRAKQGWSESHVGFKHHFETPGRPSLAAPQPVWEASAKSLARGLDVSVKCHSSGGTAMPRQLFKPGARRPRGGGSFPGLGRSTRASSGESGHPWVKCQEGGRSGSNLASPSARGRLCHCPARGCPALSYPHRRDSRS